MGMIIRITVCYLILCGGNLYAEGNYLNYIDGVIEVASKKNERLCIIMAEKIKNVLLNGTKTNDSFLLYDETVLISDSIKNPDLVKGDIKSVVFLYTSRKVSKIHITLFIYANNLIRFFIVDESRNSHIMIELSEDKVKYKIGDEEILF
jgi:hypothetical protein